MTRMATAIDDPNYQGPFGNTLLHGAAVSGDLREVRRLLAAGADPRIANRDGKTPLQAAAMLGHEEVYRVLAHRSDEHVERLLDQALEATFPASDPLAITQPSPSDDNNQGNDQREGEGINPVILRIHSRR
jgi:ankyrin repeat protein